MILKFYVEKLINTKDILSPEEYHKFYESKLSLTKQEQEKKDSSYSMQEVHDLIEAYDQEYGIGDLLKKAMDDGRFGNYPAKRSTAKTMVNCA